MLLPRSFGLEPCDFCEYLLLAALMLLMMGFQGTLPLELILSVSLLVSTLCLCAKSFQGTLPLELTFFAVFAGGWSVVLFSLFFFFLCRYLSLSCSS